MPAVQVAQVSTHHEIEAVRKLFLNYREGLFSKCQMPDQEWQRLPGVYAPPAGALLLATIAGEPAGCVGMRSFPEPGTAEMKRLYVLPAFRGLCVGESLVQAVMRVARERGYTRMRLDTHVPTMSAAITLYRRLGFEEVPAHPLSPAEDLIYMAADLK